MYGVWFFFFFSFFSISGGHGLLIQTTCERAAPRGPQNHLPFSSHPLPACVLPPLGPRPCGQGPVPPAAADAGLGGAQQGAQPRSAAASPPAPEVRRGAGGSGQPAGGTPSERPPRCSPSPQGRARLAPGAVARRRHQRARRRHRGHAPSPARGRAL